MISAHDIANAYAEAVSAYWRSGDDGDLRQLSSWINQFWSVHLYEPSDTLAAVTPHVAGERGIHWYEAGATIVGYVSGRQGCYRIPRALTLLAEINSAHESTFMLQGCPPTSEPFLVLLASLREPTLGVRR